jgi:hypothetical protein
VRYGFDKKRRLIVTTAEGCIVFNDIKSHQDRLLADPEFDPSLDQLIDTTPAMKFDLSADEARILAERHILSSNSRRAFVAVKPHIYGLGRIMKVYQEGSAHTAVEVFYSMYEALAWLAR